MASSGATMFYSSKHMCCRAHVDTGADFICFRKGKLVMSNEGKVLQTQTWKEILDQLREHLPDIDHHLTA